MISPFKLAAMILQARLPEASLRRLRDRRLRGIVDHAYKNVAYYQNLFDSAGVRPKDVRTAGDLRKLPLTTKEDLLSVSLSERIAGTTKLSRCVRQRTSGSTGVHLDVWLSHEELVTRALCDLRGLRANGIRLTDRYLVIRDTARLPPMRSVVQNFGLLRHEYLDSMTTRQKKLDRLFAGGYEVLRSDITELTLLAEEIIASGRRPPPPRILRTGAETMTPKRRTLIREAFGTYPLDFYGTVEFGYVAWECPQHDGLHVSSDLFVLEVLGEDGPCAPGETGRVAVTSLFYKTMPLIRYDLGDLAAWAAGPCPCGCRLPRLQSVSGRAVDPLVLPTGERISPFVIIRTLKSVPGLERFQAVQESPDRLMVSYVGPPAGRTIVSKLREHLGPGVSIETRRLEAIPRGPGVFKAVRCLIDPPPKPPGPRPA